MPVMEGPAVSLTMRLNVSLMEAPAGSVAVTRTGRVEASASAGVPEKLRERGSKVSQAGRGAPEAVPSSIRAVYERVSAGLGSLKLAAGRV